MAADAAHGLLELADQRRVVAPLALPRGGDGFVEPARHGQQHGDGVVGHLGGVDAGHVAGEDAQLGGCRQVDGIDTDAHARHHLELGAGFHHLAAGIRSGVDQGAVGVAQQVDHVFGGASISFNGFDPRFFKQVKAVVFVGHQGDFQGHCGTPCVRGILQNGGDNYADWMNSTQLPSGSSTMAMTTPGRTSVRGQTILCPAAVMASNTSSRLLIVIVQ